VAGVKANRKKEEPDISRQDAKNPKKNKTIIEPPRRQENQEK
jgi:hypothetical protein